MSELHFPSLQTGNLDPDSQWWRQVIFDWLGNINSDQTRRAYAQAWRDFMQAINVSHPLKISRSHLIAYKEDLSTQLSPRTGRPYSQMTINQRLSAISSFFAYAQQQGLVEANPVDGVTLKNANPYGKATHLNIAIHYP